jgi:hypothetical protein
MARPPQDMPLWAVTIFAVTLAGCTVLFVWGAFFYEGAKP